MNDARIRVFVFAAVLLACVARAQPVAEWTLRGSEAVGSPQTLIVVDSLATQLERPGGERTIAMVRRAGLLAADGRVVSAWNRLSDALGIDARTAVDRLFGTRVLFVTTGLGIPMPRDWVLATVMPREDAPRVLKGLGAVHRDVIAGSPVFLIERGAYRLCVLRHDADDRVLVLGPGDAGALFEDAVRGLSGVQGRAWFASDWPVEAEGGVLVRFGSGEAVSLAYASAKDEGWSGEAVSRAPLPADTPTWSAEDARALVEGSVLGMVGSGHADALSGAPIAPFLGINRAAAASVMGEATRRGMVRVTRDDDGRTRVSLAMETAPGRAAEVDAAMRMLVAVVTGQPQGSPAFDGRLPTAARAVPLGGGFSERLGPVLVGDRPTLGWRTAKHDDDSGLLAVTLGPGGSPVGTLDRSLADLDSADAGELVSAGRLEPGPLGALIERAAGVNRPVLGWAWGMESVTWETRRLDEKRVKARFEIRLRGAD